MDFGDIFHATINIKQNSVNTWQKTKFPGNVIEENSPSWAEAWGTRAWDTDWRRCCLTSALRRLRLRRTTLTFIPWVSKKTPKSKRDLMRHKVFTGAHVVFGGAWVTLRACVLREVARLTEVWSAQARATEATAKRASEQTTAPAVGGGGSTRVACAPLRPASHSLRLKTTPDAPRRRRPLSDTNNQPRHRSTPAWKIFWCSAQMRE